MRWHRSLTFRALIWILQMMKEAGQLMGFTEVKILLDANATLENIKQNFEQWLIKGTGPGDRVLFYFSGHGTQKADNNGDEADGFDEVLACHDLQLSGDTLVNGFDDDTFGALIARLQAKEIFIFIDACHSGSATKDISLIPPDSAPKFFFYKGLPRGMATGNFIAKESGVHANYIGLSACQDDESALASSRGSYFTQGILSNLRLASQNAQKMNMLQLQERVGGYIQENVDRQLEVFHPQVSGDLAMAKDINILKVEPHPASESGQSWKTWWTGQPTRFPLRPTRPGLNWENFFPSAVM